MEYVYYNEDADTELILEVDYRIAPRDPGSRRGHPDNWYPAEGGEMERLEVYDHSGADITGTLSGEILEEISKMCYQDDRERAHNYASRYY